MDISRVERVKCGCLVGDEYHFYLIDLHVLAVIILGIFGNREVVADFIGFQNERSVRDTGLGVLFPPVAVFFHDVLSYGHEGEECRKVEEIGHLRFQDDLECLIIQGLDADLACLCLSVKECLRVFYI